MTDSFYGIFGWITISQMAPMRLVVYVKVDFDYNAFTFVPIEQPRLISVDRVASPTNSYIHSLYDETLDFQRPSHVPSDVDFAPVISFIEYDKGNRGLVQTNMIPYQGDVLAGGVSLETMQEAVRSELTLTSKKRQKWMPRKQANLKKQTNVLRESDSFVDWIMNAFRQQCPERRSLSRNAVVVRVKEGFNLGEIQSLESFEVVKAKEAKDLYRRKIAQVKGDTDDSFVYSQFNSGSVATALFLGNSDGMCQVVSVDLGELDEKAKGTTTSVKECDDAARSAFDELCRVSLPAVTNPSLN